MNKKHIYLTGYEKETIDEFLSKLKNESITSVIDVREYPLSRKKGFSKNGLRENLAKVGIEYFHLKELGSPKKMRDDLKETGDYLTFFKKYRLFVKRKASKVKEAIKIIKDNGKNSAILCFERNSDLCHRSIVASEILKHTHNLKVTSL